MRTHTYHLLTLQALIALALALWLGTSQGQTAQAGKVLKGSAVTEQNLLEALTPDEEPIVTRSLKVERNRPLPPPRRPAASLLITFETNSADLTAQARRQLDVVGQALRNNKLAEYNFSVEGHADPRGASDTNLTLSQRRADSVRDYLVSAHAIDPSRLKSVGKGASEVLNASNPAAPENRRVTIVTNISTPAAQPEAGGSQ